MLSLIVARSRNNVIGNAQGIPWRIKGEQKQFKELTTFNVVIMGRKTYEDIGRPLPNRMTIVVSKTKTYTDNTPGSGYVLETARSLPEAIELAKSRCTGGYPQGEIYIAGGYSLYKEALPLVDRMYITEIDLEVPVDETTVFFPGFREDEFECHVGVTEGDDVKYTRKTYIRPESLENSSASRPESDKTITLAELAVILDEAFVNTAGTKDMCRCSSCTLSYDCESMPLGSESYCTARKFKYIAMHRAKELAK